VRYEGDALASILDRVLFVLPELADVGADQGVAAERVWGERRAADRRAYPSAEDDAAARRT